MQGLLLAAGAGEFDTEEGVSALVCGQPGGQFAADGVSQNEYTCAAVDSFEMMFDRRIRHVDAYIGIGQFGCLGIRAAVPRSVECKHGESEGCCGAQQRESGCPGQSKYAEFVAPPCTARMTARGSGTSISNADMGMPSTSTVRCTGARSEAIVPVELATTVFVVLMYPS